MQILRDASIKSCSTAKSVFFEAYRRKGVPDPELSANKAWRHFCANGQDVPPAVVIDHCLDLLAPREEHHATVQ